MKKLFLILFLAIFLITFARANYYTDATGANYNAIDGFSSNINGIQVNATNATLYKIFNVSKVDGDGATFVQIYRVLNQTMIANGTYIGDVANVFAPDNSAGIILNQNETYDIIDTANGAVWQDKYGGCTFPIQGVGLQYTMSRYGASYGSIASDPNNCKSVANITWGEAYNASIGLSVNLLSPVNNSQIASLGTNFSVNTTSLNGNGNLTNITYDIWFNNGTLFNQTTMALNGTTNLTNIFIDSFSLFTTYLWNAQVCAINSTTTACLEGLQNLTFTTSYNLNGIANQNFTYETDYNVFNLSIGVIASSFSTTANLNYNGTIYPSTVSCFSVNCTILNILDAPKTESSSSMPKFFFWTINLTDTTKGTSTITQTAVYNQTVIPINYSYCPLKPYNMTYINFTTTDELTSNQVFSQFQSIFYYWLGSGSVKKNYSYSDTTQTNANYSFCFDPINRTMYLDSDINYLANLYSPNAYSTRAANLTNITTPITLYLLNTTQSAKFYVNFKQGTAPITQSLVIISKKFPGTGQFKTVGARITDNTGQIPAYLALDSDYFFAVIQNGTLIGTSEQTASCASSPCAININIGNGIGDIFGGYNNNFAGNIVSNISFNTTSQIVTYNFLDITGSAHYFRLEVDKNILNGTITQSVCNVFSYSSFGTLSCNVTGLSGDFVAKTFISRSPEKIDQVLGFIISSIKDNLGFFLLLLDVIIIITVVYGGAVTSKGNPSTIIILLGIAILLLKIAELFPFSWIIVVSLEALFAFLIRLLKV